MSGAGFGAFMGGLAGGYSAGKGIKDMMATSTPQPGVAGSKASDYSGDLSKFEPGKLGAAEAAAPEATSQKEGAWGSLSGVLSSLQEQGGKLPGIAGGIFGAADKSIAGKLLGGGDPFGKTIIGKFLK